jgi:hypothetical protein
MKWFRPVVLVAIFLSMAGPFSGQTAPRVVKSPVHLLPGYRLHEQPNNIDVYGATISRNDGVTLSFTAYGHTGILANMVEPSDLEWREEQVVNGEQMVCAYTKSHKLIASFPRMNANFEADIRNDRDIAQALLMILTYDGTHAYPADGAKR